MYIFAAGQHCGEDVLQGPMQVLRAERGQRCAGPHRTKGRSLHLAMKGSCARPVPTTVVVGDVRFVLHGANGEVVSTYPPLLKLALGHV